jgi:3-dehydroquinate synthetase
MNRLQEILSSSKDVDAFFLNASSAALDSFKITFEVPRAHVRSNIINQYEYIQTPLSDLDVYLSKQGKYKPRCFVTKHIADLPFVGEFCRGKECEVLESVESKLKTLREGEKLLESLGKISDATLIAIGGGLLCNVVAFLAERTSSRLVLVPSTVLSMMDSSGGKVRMNALTDSGGGYKHFYKSFYEPDVMIMEQRFLSSLPVREVKIGLVEIIKHGLFQSEMLYDFLVENVDEILESNDGSKRSMRSLEKIKKAVLWAAMLKKVCLDIDVEEQDNGSKTILRGGHGVSDRLEEDLKFSIPHGYAVAIGIIDELTMKNESISLRKAKAIFDLYRIPYTREMWLSNLY